MRAWLRRKWRMLWLPPRVALFIKIPRTWPAQTWTIEGRRQFLKAFILGRAKVDIHPE